MSSQLSKKEILDAFQLLRLSSKKQRDHFKKLLHNEENGEKTHIFIRTTMGTEIKDKEEDVARLE